MSQLQRRSKYWWWCVTTKQEFIDYTKELKEVLDADNADCLTDDLNRCVLRLHPYMYKGSPSPRDDVVTEFYEAFVAANKKHSFVRKLSIDSPIPMEMITSIITDRRSVVHELAVRTEKSASDEEWKSLVASIENCNEALQSLSLYSGPNTRFAGDILNAVFQGNFEALSWWPYHGFDLFMSTPTKVCWKKLSTNTTLKTLKLANLSKEDWIAMAQALSINTTVTRVDFNFNSYGTLSKKVIAAMDKMIRTNETITTFASSSEMMKKLTEAIMANPTITFVDYTHFENPTDRSRHPWEPEVKLNRNARDFLLGYPQLLREITLPLSAYPHLLARVSHKPLLVSKVLAQKTLLDQLLAPKQQEKLSTNEPNQKRIKLS